MQKLLVLRIPLVLAALSLPPVYFLNDPPTPGVLAFWAIFAFFVGLGVNCFIAIYRRSRRIGRQALPVRSSLATLTSFVWCSIGFTLAVMSVWYISDLMSVTHMHRADEAPGILGGLVLAVAAIFGLCGGVVGFLYITRSLYPLYFASMIFNLATFVFTILWSLVSFPVYAQSSSHAHAAGAGIGGFLFAIGIPVIANLFLILHALLMFLLRKLSDKSVTAGEMS